MSDQSEDLSESLAAELTGSVGMSDQPGTGELLPNDVAADVEAQEAYLAEKDLALSTDQDDTRQGSLSVRRRPSSVTARCRLLPCMKSAAAVSNSSCNSKRSSSNCSSSYTSNSLLSRPHNRHSRRLQSLTLTKTRGGTSKPRSASSRSSSSS